jgi:lipopolysaccharide exporter
MVLGLAWILDDPEEPDAAAAMLGVLGAAMLVRELLDMLGDFGVGQAVLRQKDLDRPFLLAAFSLNFILGAVISTALFLAAPLATLWFQDFDHDVLVGVLQGLSVSFFLGWLAVVHRGLLMREMRFDLLAAVELGSTGLMLLLTLLGAAAGHGLWGYVWGQGLGSLLALGLLLRFSPFRPALTLDLRPLASAWKFMRSLLGFNLLNFWSNSLDRAIVGRLGDVALGQYDLTLRLVLYPMRMFAQGLTSVLTAAFSLIQGDDSALRDRLMRASASLALLAAPVSLGLIVVAKPLVATLLGPDMAPVAEYVRILAPIGLLQSLTFVTGSLFMAKGRTDWLLRWTIVTLPLIAAALWIGSMHGVQGVAWAYLTINAVLALPALKLAFRLIDLEMSAFLRAVSPPIGAACLMALGAAAALDRLAAADQPAAVQLSGATATGVVLYGAMVWTARLHAASNLLRVMGFALDHALVRRFTRPVERQLMSPEEKR